MSRIKTIIPTCLAAAGLLAGGLLLSPPAQAESLQTQEQPKSKVITLSGIAINPDGSPAADLPVEIKAANKQLVGTGGAGGGGGGQAPPPELLSQDKKQQNDFIVLGKGTTDSEGKFSIKFEHKDVKSYQLEIGNKMESAWITKPLENKGKDTDLGKIQLREKVS